MLKIRPIAALSLLAVLAACASTVEQRVTIPVAEVQQKQRIAFGSVALREVSLPTYGGAEEVFIVNEFGLLSKSEGIFWADDPTRAITLEMTRHLTQISGARVASEPWPFEDSPQATVELRVEDMLAGTDGIFRLSGQYFVTSENGRNRAKLFDLEVPIQGELGAASIAAALARAVQDLAYEIARNGLR